MDFLWDLQSAYEGIVAGILGSNLKSLNWKDGILLSWNLDVVRGSSILTVETDDLLLGKKKKFIQTFTSGWCCLSVFLSTREDWVCGIQGI